MGGAAGRTMGRAMGGAAGRTMGRDRRVGWTLMGAVLVVALVIGSLSSGPTPSNDERLRELSASLKCPQCAGQSVAESEAPIAVAMRDKIGEMVGAGRSDAEIRGYFVESYGDVILLSPPATGFGILVWVVPVLGLVAGSVGLWFILRRRRPPSDAAANRRHDKHEHSV